MKLGIGDYGAILWTLGSGFELSGAEHFGEQFIVELDVNEVVGVVVLSRWSSSLAGERQHVLDGQRRADAVGRRVAFGQNRRADHLSLTHPQLRIAQRNPQSSSDPRSMTALW